jgi:hypothetical protein
LAPKMTLRRKSGAHQWQRVFWHATDDEVIWKALRWVLQEEEEARSAPQERMEDGMTSVACSPRRGSGSGAAMMRGGSGG